MSTSDNLAEGEFFDGEEKTSFFRRLRKRFVKSFQKDDECEMVFERIQGSGEFL